MAHGDIYSYLSLVDPAKDPVDHAKFRVFDPNTNKENEILVNLSKYEGECLHKLAAKDLLMKQSGPKREEISIKYQILDNSTSLFVAEKIVDQVSQEVKLRKVPLIAS